MASVLPACAHATRDQSGESSSRLARAICLLCKGECAPVLDLSGAGVLGLVDEVDVEASPPSVPGPGNCPFLQMGELLLWTVATGMTVTARCAADSGSRSTLQAYKSALQRAQACMHPKFACTWTRLAAAQAGAAQAGGPRAWASGSMCVVTKDARLVLRPPRTPASKSPDA